MFDQELARHGEELMARRSRYMELLIPFAQENYAQISRGSEPLQLHYKPSCEPGQLAQLLAQARSSDLRAGFGTAGPHREDFEVLLAGQPARLYASQGQQRSAVLSLKLAEASCTQQITGEHPVMLLDDVLSELDAVRQEYLLTRMRGKQTIVTACDSSLFHKTEGVMVCMEQGTLRPL